MQATGGAAPAQAHRAAAGARPSPPALVRGLYARWPPAVDGAVQPVQDARVLERAGEEVDERVRALLLNVHAVLHLAHLALARLRQQVGGLWRGVGGWWLVARGKQLMASGGGWWLERMVASGWWLVVGGK